MSDEDILVRVNAVIARYGCVATDLGPDTVGVKGDNRFCGPAVFVRFPRDMPQNEIATISTTITNSVPEIGRVLMEIH